MLPWYAQLGGDVVVAVAILGVLLAAVVAPLLAPRVHPLLAYAVTLVLVWLCLAALLDTYALIYAPR